MTSISVNIQIGPEQQALLQRLTQQNLLRFVKSQAPALVTQVRANIVKFGAKAGTEWPPLSVDYAKKKRDGDTPGAGKHKYAMLRDTGEMYSNITAEGYVANGVLTMDLTAQGARNAFLLGLHAMGSGRLPARNPALRMNLFEARFLSALVAMLGDVKRDRVERVG